MKKCPFCGADIEESARFCLYCMQSLTEKEQIFPRRKKKPQWWLTVVAIAITLLTLAAAWFGIQIALGNGTPSDTSSVGGSVHTPAAAVKEKYIDSSCTETGSYDEVVYCSVCEEELSRTQKTVDKKPHNYNQKVTTTKYLKTEATETSPAVYYYSCACGAKGTNTFTGGGVLGHTHNFNQKDTSATYRKSPATCTKLAVYYYSCTCGEKGSTTFTSGTVLPHTFDQRNTDSSYQKSPATCTKAAVYYYSCSCGEKGSATFTSGAVLPHTFGGWIVDTVATCVEPGKRHHVCTVCQESVSETYSDPNAHSYDTEWAADDIYHWHTCSRCNSIKDKQEHLLDDNGKCSLCAHQTTVSNNGFVYMISEDGTYAEIVDYTASETSVVIAATYKDIPVIKIGSSAFQGKNITSVDIPNSVTSIGSSAFSDCALTDVTIPDSVTRIGDYAFCNCDSLVSINYNGIVAQWQSITKYSNWDYNTADYTIFCTDGQITKDGTVTYSKAASEGLEFTLNSDGESYSVTGIGTCTDADIVIPSTYNSKPVTSIGSSAFRERNSLTSVTIGDGVTSIGSSAFRDCRSLTSVTIGNGVTVIGNYAFYDCDSLTSIEIPDSVTSMGSDVFRSCHSLTSVKIGNGVTSIGEYAFEGCDSLTSIEIPDSVTSIGVYAFAYCDSLASVTIGNSVTSIGSYAFCSCWRLTNIKYCGTASQWSAISKGDAWDYDTGAYTITYNYTGE